MTSLTNDEFGQFIKVACPHAGPGALEFLWNFLSEPDRLTVVNEGEMQKVHSIEKCCGGRISRARKAGGQKSDQRKGAYVPSPDGYQAVAASAAPTVTDGAAIEPRVADSGTISPEFARAARQVDRAVSPGNHRDRSRSRTRGHDSRQAEHLQAGAVVEAASASLSFDERAGAAEGAEQRASRKNEQRHFSGWLPPR